MIVTHGAMAGAGGRLVNGHAEYRRVPGDPEQR
jgi:hypothetical protein